MITLLSQSSVKYRGSVLDNDLSGTSIVNNIIKKVNSRIRFLYRQNHCLNMELRKLLCNALVQCHFDYVSSSWYNGISKQLKTTDYKLYKIKLLDLVMDMTLEHH